MNLISVDLTKDVYAETPISFNKTRRDIYHNSEIITKNTDGQIIEIFGYLSLEEKYALWDSRGQPSEFLFYSVTDRIICDYSYIANEIKKDDSVEMAWCIGWISSNREAYIFVDFINVMIDYSYECWARELSKERITEEPTAI